MNNKLCAGFVTAGLLTLVLTLLYGSYLGVTWMHANDYVVHHAGVGGGCYAWLEVVACIVMNGFLGVAGIFLGGLILFGVATLVMFGVTEIYRPVLKWFERHPSVK